MAADTLTLFCLINGEPRSEGFKVKIVADTETDVSDLKNAIKEKQKDALDFAIPANKLVLWQATIPHDEIAGGGRIIKLDSLDDKTKLDDPWMMLSELTMNSSYGKSCIIVERPKELPLPPKKKIRITEGWKEYEAADKKTVLLPESWIHILKSDEFVPEPRGNFKLLKNDLQVGQCIEIPSLGQTPKDFGKYGPSIESPSRGQTPKDFGKYDPDQRLFFTEQMKDLWEDIYKDKTRTYRRVLSGPMGVGKTYLSYFLAARAYAEGWLVLYIADAGRLDTLVEEEADKEVVRLFLALNKNILTAAEFE
ncbi:hypothetical protein EMPS_04215 [Entomortierella parvispora]|uniref:Crinkler effector protein N-terminal domain-containing protein n=1 Tax=Entomortierella parvispora TaxID=205924 RepID=A0A9P3LV96_9FUNG|nr:hypothetical protein EMPS_04215 [Entomortierella parvispora]